MRTRAQIKKKMTREEFIRNNRGINGPKDAPVDLPKEFLGDLFDAFSRKAIRFPELPNGPPAARHSTGADPTVVKCAKTPPKTLNPEYAARGRTAPLLTARAQLTVHVSCIAPCAASHL